MITPPVAFAAYAAANIARVSGWTTGWTAVVVGWSTFFIPFLFVTEPTLLMAGSWEAIVWDVTRNLLGIFVGTAAVIGFAFTTLAPPMRIAFGAAALAILMPPNVFPGADVLDWSGSRRGHPRGLRLHAQPRFARRGRGAPRGTLNYAFSRHSPSASCAGRSEIENNTDSFLAWWLCFIQDGTTNTSFGPHSSVVPPILVVPSPSTQTKIVESVDW
jgi:hypothetical protein